MNREKAIQIIESLYPADAEYVSASEIGCDLLEQAKRNVENWRDLSDEVLQEYARLCMEKEKQLNGV